MILSIADMESTIAMQISIDIKSKLNPIEQRPKPYTTKFYRKITRHSKDP